MNIVIWMLAGGIIGWLAFSAMGFNESRGKMVSVGVGAFGGVLGGKMVAPMLIAAPAVPSDAFSWGSLFIAFAVAASLLAIGNTVQNRWGV
jgi:uncharacterized membrane protein YeaQ/YmgE (transglycosylase-associated protein family)